MADLDVLELLDPLLARVLNCLPEERPFLRLVCKSFRDRLDESAHALVLQLPCDEDAKRRLLQRFPAASTAILVPEGIKATLISEQLAAEAVAAFLNHRGLCNLFNLRGLQPEEASSLGRLEVLALTTCQLAGQPPALPRLRVLVLQRVRFEPPFVAALTASTRLQGLSHCSHFRGLALVNTLGRKDSLAFLDLLKLDALRCLDLSSNKHFSDSVLAQMLGMRQLRLLNLSHTAMTSRGMAALSDLTALETLGLANCPWITTPRGLLSILQTFPALRDLDISVSRSVELTPLLLQSMSRLTRLKAAHAPLRYTAARADYRWLAGLKSLDLSHGGPCERTPQSLYLALDLLTALTHLNVSASHEATDEAVALVASLTGLRSLDMSRLKSLPGSSLRRLTSLTALTELKIAHCTGFALEDVLALSELPLSHLHPPSPEMWEGHKSFPGRLRDVVVWNEGPHDSLLLKTLAEARNLRDFARASMAD